MTIELVNLDQWLWLYISAGVLVGLAIGVLYGIAEGVGFGVCVSASLALLLGAFGWGIFKCVELHQEISYTLSFTEEIQEHYDLALADTRPIPHTTKDGIVNPYATSAARVKGNKVIKYKVVGAVEDGKFFLYSEGENGALTKMEPVTAK